MEAFQTPLRLCIKGILPALLSSCGKHIAFAFKESSYLAAGLFKIHFCSWGCSKWIAWEREARPLSLFCSDTSNIDDIAYSMMASLNQGRVHWRFSLLLSEQKEFRAMQVCYERVFVDRDSGKCILVKGLYLSYLRLCFWSAGDSGKCVANL